MTNQNRYKLKVGKFGYYFYDSRIQVDLTLDMVLTKLNNSEKLIIDRLEMINNLNQKILELTITNSAYYEYLYNNDLLKYIEMREI